MFTDDTRLTLDGSMPGWWSVLRTDPTPRNQHVEPTIPCELAASLPRKLAANLHRKPARKLARKLAHKFAPYLIASGVPAPAQ